MAPKVVRHAISTKDRKKRDSFRFRRHVTFCMRSRRLTSNGEFAHVSYVTQWRINQSNTYGGLTVWAIISGGKTCACFATPNNAFIGQLQMQDTQQYSIQETSAWQFTAGEASVYGSSANQSSKGGEMRMACGNWDTTTHRWWASGKNITTVLNRPHLTLSGQKKLLRMCTVSLQLLGWSYTCTQQRDFQQNSHSSKQLHVAITSHGRE
jgi:hypothetical protein